MCHVCKAWESNESLPQWGTARPVEWNPASTKGCTCREFLVWLNCSRGEGEAQQYLLLPPAAPMLAAGQNSPCSCQHWQSCAVLQAAGSHLRGCRTAHPGLFFMLRPAQVYLQGLKDCCWQLSLGLFPKDFYYAFWEQVTLYWGFIGRARVTFLSDLWFGRPLLPCCTTNSFSSFDKKLQWGALWGCCLTPAGHQAAHSNPVPLRGSVFTKITSENCLSASCSALSYETDISLCSQHEWAALESDFSQALVDPDDQLRNFTCCFKLKQNPSPPLRYLIVLALNLTLLTLITTTV